MNTSTAYRTRCDNQDGCSVTKGWGAVYVVNIWFTSRTRQREISSLYTEQLQFKTYGLFISGIPPLPIFSHCSWPWVTETPESKNTVKWAYCIPATTYSQTRSILRSWELGLQHINFGGHNSTCNTP